MNANWKTQIAIGVLLLVAAVYTGYRLMEKPTPPVETGGTPGIEFVETTLIGRKGGEKQWEIVSKSVLQQEDVVIIGDMETITIFQGDRPQLDVRAQQGLWERKENTLTLRSSVEVRDVDGEFWLKSDELIHTEHDSTLTSPGPVEMLWNGMEIRAGRMVYAAEAGLLHLLDGVTIADGNMEFGVKEAVYDFEREILDFYGQIVLETKAGVGNGED